MPYLSLTTWSLHRHLGPMRWTRWDETNQTHVPVIQEQPETISLLNLPSVAAGKGFRSLEVIHSHIVDTSDEFLARLRDSFAEAGIRFYTLLIDYGDISSADPVRRSADIGFIQSWIDIAAKAGAERVRVIGGDASPDDQAAFQRSAEAMRQLIPYAKERGVRIVTENFHSLTSTSANCVRLLEACDRDIGLTSDFGNFTLPNKYAELTVTIPLSESIHAKASCNAEGIPDADEFERCLGIAKASGYEGPFTLVYDGPGDMWEGIERVKKLAEPYL